eukprot:6210980-Pleurochrysis_carterae.AAC.1
MRRRVPACGLIDVCIGYRGAAAAALRIEKGRNMGAKGRTQADRSVEVRKYHPECIPHETREHANATLTKGRQYAQTRHSAWQRDARILPDCPVPEHSEGAARTSLALQLMSAVVAAAGAMMAVVMAAKQEPGKPVARASYSSQAVESMRKCRRLRQVG